MGLFSPCGSDFSPGHIFQNLLFDQDRRPSWKLARAGVAFPMRVSSYEPGNRDECCCLFISEFSARSPNTTKIMEHKLESFPAVVALWTLLTLLIKLIRLLLKWNTKVCHFGCYVAKTKLFCLKKVSSRLLRPECSYGNIFIPVTEISVAKAEISVTRPALPLIIKGRLFYKNMSLSVL